MRVKTFKRVSAALLTLVLLAGLMPAAAFAADAVENTAPAVEDFKRIIAITYEFSSGWRKIHNPETGHDVADDLTTTEFAAAMLAARNWTNPEIAEHMNISVNTVKHHISQAMKKLNVGNRKDLKKYMLE